ncbi:MAG: hypothetical protein KAH32_01320 [Chlamydiia bacterium]|nr:hypothetical protein [Chlamydiia bacterium]
MSVSILKYVFLGFIGDVSDFMKESQNMGKIQFGDSNFSFDVNESKNIDAIKRTSNNVNSIAVESLLSVEGVEGLKYLNKDQSFFEKKGVMQIADEIISMKQEENTLINEKNKIIGLIATYNSLGVDSMLSLRKQCNDALDFYVVSSSERLRENISPNIVSMPIRTLNKKKWSIVFDFIRSVKKFIESMPADAECLDITFSLSELNDQLCSLNRKIDNITKELHLHAFYIEGINDAFAGALNSTKRESAKENIKSMEGSIFYIEGWIKDSDFYDVLGMCSKIGIKIMPTKIKEDEIVPTAICNKGTLRIGEDIIYAYDVPLSVDMDLSSFVLPFFAIFYGIIVGDAGYGMLQIALCLFVKRRFVKKMDAALNRIFNLISILGATTIIWGLVIGNIFGIDLAKYDSTYRFVPVYYITAIKKQYMDAVYEENKIVNESIVSFDIDGKSSDFEHPSIFKDYDDYEKVRNSILFEFAILFGCFHLMLGMLINLRKKPENLGWAIVLFGSFFGVSRYMDAVNAYDYLLSGYFGAFIYTISYYIIYIGVALAISMSMFCNGILVGFFEITSAIQLFSDVMSYLRLYALGLSGGIMAATFNSMGYSMGCFGIPVIVLGHAINILLCVMGGAIHGTRLNFLEWFRYCFEGGGIKFKPLKNVKSINEE